MRLLYGVIFCVAIVGLTNATAFAQNKRVEGKSLELQRSPREGQQIVVTFPTQSFKPLDGHRVVFVVNGVANGTAATDTLLALNGEYGLGLKLRTVNWCRHDSIRLDLVDHEAQLNAAARIVTEVTMIRRDAPNAKIYFVAHSAGTRAVLAAAEMLPPNSVERIILIASAVSCSYDLTTALRASRHGIDNFYSFDDRVVNWAVESVGTSDGLRGQAAGRVGFRPPHASKHDVAALRQHAWAMELDGLGGHFAWTRSRNMKRCIVPLLFHDENPPAVITEPIKGPAKK